MPTNQGFTMEIKNNDGNYISLYPNTIQQQVNDWGIGEIFGPYTLILPSNGWSNNEITIDFQEMNTGIVLSCVKVLSGTQEVMQQQDQAYSFLTSIESLDGAVLFECSQTPSIDLQVQIWWTE